MDESFRVRIDKIFGSLSSSSSSSAPVSSLWCLAEDEIIERKGEKEVSGLSNSVDIGGKENESEKLSVGGDEGKSSELEKPDDYNDEEWEIKSSIGMDSTLDMEEEEDDIDKVALGEKVYGYMKDVNDYETEADEWEELPVSLKEREKDPRANLIAAKLRLKEDADAVNKLNSLHVSEVHDQDNMSMSMSESEKALVVSEYNLLSTCKETHVGTSDDNELKSILKRKENQPDTKLQKRVRFSSDIKDDYSNEGDKDSMMETNSPNEDRLEPEHPSGIPDYMRNPSKYTRYTFDSGEVDEESNRKAYMEFLNMIRRQDEPPVNSLVELPKSVPFVPKKKPMAETKVDNIDKVCEGRRGTIAVDTREDSNVSAMEEDEPETTVNAIRKPSRQYRVRAKEDGEEC